ncbi:MAG: hypothetical protein RIC89_09410 [Pseudomonadales bacterium]
MRALFFLLVLLTSTAWSEVSFNTSNVGKFISSLSEVQKVSDKYGHPDSLGGDGMDIKQSMARAQAPFSSSIPELQSYAGYDEVVTIIESSGFGDINQWAAFGDRVMRAYGAIKLASEAPDVNEQMAQARKQLENSGLTEAQKKMLLEVMGSANQVMDTFKDVPQADRAAVKPHVEKLDNL